MSKRPRCLWLACPLGDEPPTWPCSRTAQHASALGRLRRTSRGVQGDWLRGFTCEPRAAEFSLRTSRRVRCDKLILPVHYSVNHAARRRRMPGVRDGLPEKDTRRKEELGTKIEVSHEKCLYPGDCPGSEESLRRESPGREYLQFGRTFQSLLSPWDTSAFVPESAVKRVLFRSAYRLAASQSAATAHRCAVCGWRGRSTSAAPSRAR